MVYVQDWIRGPRYIRNPDDPQDYSAYTGDPNKYPTLEEYRAQQALVNRNIDLTRDTIPLSINPPKIDVISSKNSSISNIAASMIGLSPIVLLGGFAFLVLILRR